MTLCPPRHRPYTLADFFRQLGDVSPDRIRLHPPLGTATAADLTKPDNALCELVDGTLVEKAMGRHESLLAAWLSMVVNQYVVTHNLGTVTGEAGFYELPGGLVRGPDVAFVSWDREAGRKRSADPIPLLTPDLAVEVLSLGNATSEMTRKRVEYFDGGSVWVWEIDPRARWLRVYSAAETYTELTAADTLTGDPVLPGFTLKLADLFAELDRHG